MIDQREFMQDLKSVYKAFNEESDVENLDILKEKWTSLNQNWASTLGQLTIMFEDRIPSS